MRRVLGFAVFFGWCSRTRLVFLSRHMTAHDLVATWENAAQRVVPASRHPRRIRIFAPVTVLEPSRLRFDDILAEGRRRVIGSRTLPAGKRSRAHSVLAGAPEAPMPDLKRGCAALVRTPASPCTRRTEPRATRRSRARSLVAAGPGERRGGAAPRSPRPAPPNSARQNAARRSAIPEPRALPRPIPAAGRRSARGAAPRPGAAPRARSADPRATRRPAQPRSRVLAGAPEAPIHALPNARLQLRASVSKGGCAAQLRARARASRT
jgi:hypothetical protein